MHKKFLMLVLGGALLALQSIASFAQDLAVATHVPKSEIMAARRNQSKK